MAKSPVISVILGNADNALDISGMVDSLSYSRSIYRDDTVEVEIKNIFVDYLLEQPACNAGQPITFSYGFIGETLSPSTTLILADIEPVYTGGGTRLRLSNVDVSQAMRKLHSSRVWKNMRHDEIIEELARLHGIPSDIQQVLIDPKSQEVNLKYSDNPNSDSTTFAGTITTETQTDPTRLAQYKAIQNIAIGGGKTVPYKKLSSLPQGWRNNQQMFQDIAAMLPDGMMTYVTRGTIYCRQKNTGDRSVAVFSRGGEDVLKFAPKYKEIGGKGSQKGVSTAAGTEKFDPETTETYITLGDYHLVASDSQIFEVDGEGNRRLLKPYSDMTQAESSTDTDTGLDQTLYKALSSAHKTNVSLDDLKLFLMGKPMNESVRKDLIETTAWAQEGVVQSKEEILTAELVIIGNVNMDINTTVTISGFATRFTGNWYVRDVNDDIDDSGFITSLYLVKGEVKKGIVPTTNKNTVSGSDTQRKRSVGVQGWDNKSGFNINAPGSNVPVDNKTPAPVDKSIKITTR